MPIHYEVYREEQDHAWLIQSLMQVESVLNYYWCESNYIMDFTYNAFPTNKNNINDFLDGNLELSIEPKVELKVYVSDDYKEGKVNYLGSELTWLIDWENS